MLIIIALLATALASIVTGAETPKSSAPVYSSASIVNAASNASGALAPNTIATIYGQGLSYVTRAVGPADVGDRLPTALPGAGVRVTVCGILSPLYYVSPTQINFLVPALLASGDCTAQVVNSGVAGPASVVSILPAAPALFVQEGGWAVATFADGSLVAPDRPSRPGDVVVLYSTGLGQTSPPMSDGLIPKAAAPIERPADAAVLLAGEAAPAGNVFYVGLTPGYGGLYQVNLILPDSVGENPEVILSIGGQSSQPGVRLSVRR